MKWNSAAQIPHDTHTRNLVIIYILSEILKVLYSPYVNKAFVHIFVSKILIFIRQLFIFSSF
jgi:hypothetical protein